MTAIRGIVRDDGKSHEPGCRLLFRFSQTGVNRMNDDRNQAAPPVQSQARTFFAAMGTGSLLNIALIAWSIYEENWWITAIAVVLGIVMLAMALTAVRRSGVKRNG